MQPPPRLDLGNPPPKPSAPPHFPPPSYREETAPAEVSKGGSRFLPTLVTLGAFGGLLVLAWFAYQDGKVPVPEEEIPVIKAEEEPFKRAPENPGGEEIPHVDKEVFDGVNRDKPIANARKEVVSDADQPIDRAFLKQFGSASEEEAPEPRQEEIQFGGDQKAEPALEPKPLPLAKAEEALPTPNTGGIRLLDMKPREKAAEAPVVPVIDAKSSAAAEVEKQMAASEDEAEPAIPEIPAATTEKPEEVKKAAPVVAPKTTKEAAKKPVVAEKKKAPAETRLPAKGLRVQLGAYRSEREAETEWKRIRAKFKTALSGKTMMVQPVQVAGKGTMYRLQAGPVASREEAKGLCKKLVAAGQGCFLAK